MLDDEGIVVRFGLSDTNILRSSKATRSGKEEEVMESIVTGDGTNVSALWSPVKRIINGMA